MKQKILTMLRKSKDYLSGQEISEEMHVSRTAVWKVMEQLREQGYEIEAVRNRGYRLLSVPDVVTAEEIMSRIKTKRLGRKVIFFPKTDSTNLRAKRYSEDGGEEGLLVIAGEQTKGRGRRGQNWSSPAGDDIYMSLLLKPSLNPKSASMITLLAALSVSAAIEKAVDLKTKIKWPNDIVVNKKKVCGILTEMSSEPDFIHYIIVGIGINANAETFPPEIEKTATSLYLEQKEKKRIQRSDLICTLMELFEEYYQQFLEIQDLSFVMEEYNKKLAGFGKKVKIIGEEKTETGISRGITKTGELMVELPDGSIREVLSGEVSVRGLYGYV